MVCIASKEVRAAVLYRVWQQAMCRFAVALAKTIALSDGIHPVCPRPTGNDIRQSGIAPGSGFRF